MKGGVIAAALLSVAACGASKRPTSLPVTCSREVDRKTPICQSWLHDAQEVANSGEYPDTRLAAYVARIGQRIADVADPERSIGRWTFRVLDSHLIHGKAMGHGYVNVTRGLLAMLSSEAELAAVLAHEVAHIVSLHSHWDANHIPFGEANRRDQERQADDLAVSFLVRAGYDPRAMVAMLGAILEPHDRDASGEHAHPRPTARRARAALLASGHHGGQRYASRYMNHIDGLVVGRDPRAGTVVNGEYVHARAGLAVALPQWRVETSNWALRARRGDKRLLVLPPGPNMTAYERARLAGARRATIAGFDVEVGHIPADRSTWVALVDGGDMVVAFRLSGGTKSELLAILRGLRRATRDEVSRQPKRFKLVPAPRSATVEDLANELCHTPTVTVAAHSSRPHLKRGELLKCIR